VVRSDETGIVVAPKSVDELIKALERLLGQPCHARKMGAAAQELVQKEFTYDSVVSQYAELYRSLLTP